MRMTLGESFRWLVRSTYNRVDRWCGAQLAEGESRLGCTHEHAPGRGACGFCMEMDICDRA